MFFDGYYSGDSPIVEMSAPPFFIQHSRYYLYEPCLKETALKQPPFFMKLPILLNLAN